jgi:hypothetical protein
MPFQIAAWIVGTVVAILLVFFVIGIIRDWVAFPAFLVAAVLVGFLGWLFIVSLESTDHNNRIYDAKVAELEQYGFDDVSLEGTQFTASKGDKFIRGALYDRGNGKYEVLTEGVEK